MVLYWDGSLWLDILCPDPDVHAANANDEVVARRISQYLLRNWNLYLGSILHSFGPQMEFKRGPRILQSALI